MNIITDLTASST